MRREYVPAHILEKVKLKLPFYRYFEIFRRLPHAFLLDSASDPQKLGRYSFMGAEPFLVFRSKRLPNQGDSASLGRITILDGQAGDSVLADYIGDPLAELRQLAAAHHVDGSSYEARPAPLLSGAVGYIGYEAGHFVESIPDTGADDLGLPDIHFGFYNSCLVLCHRTGQCYISVLGRGPNERIAHARAERKRIELRAKIDEFERAPGEAWTGPKGDPPRRPPTKLVSKDDYCALVERAKEHIFAGDIFEICLTHRIESDFSADPWDFYQELRRINPAPFACYLALPEGTIVSSSPERFLRLGADRTAESRPIKGTRPRGKTEQEDQALFHDLETSIKDQAENNMIVDLVRNDFGRVCRLGTVHVPELRIIERYATVYQMVSTIRGQLDEGHDAIDLIRACFPGGSMTGAPKIETMKIIDTLEPVKRSVYSGAIGYIDFSGSVDLNIVIRTAILLRGKAYYNVGGAIVADSVPADEYQETLDKARAIMRALDGVHAP